MRDLHAPGSTLGEAALLQPIAMDCLAADLDTLLFFMLDPSKKPPFGYDLEPIEGAILLCNKYECSMVEIRIHYFVRTSIQEAPWTVFALAHRWEDLELARNAISHMSLQNSPSGSLSFARIDVLLRPILYCDLKSDQNGDLNRDQWTQVARNFTFLP